MIPINIHNFGFNQKRPHILVYVTFSFNV